MATKKKIFSYTSKKSEEIIEGCLDKYKKEYGIFNGFLLEKWILTGIASENNAYSQKANELIKERYTIDRES